MSGKLKNIDIEDYWWETEAPKTLECCDTDCTQRLLKDNK